MTIGVASWEDSAIVCKNADIFKSGGSGFTKINVPDYGTPLVNGASQTGSSLAIDGLTSAPQAGDVFKVAGIDKVYTVLQMPQFHQVVLPCQLILQFGSSPADDAVITFLSTSREGANKTRFESIILTVQKRLHLSMV